VLFYTQKGVHYVLHVVAFVRPSVRPFVAYIANNSRTQRPSMPKFGMKIPHIRCDSDTSFKVKRSKVRVTDGRTHIVSAELGGHTACFFLSRENDHTYRHEDFRIDRYWLTDRRAC